jgi:hypothetical protein
MALGGHEDQHVAAGRLAAEFIDGVEHGTLQVGIVVVFLGGERPVADVDRVIPARDFDHRRRPARRCEMPAEADRVDRGRGNDHLQVAPPGNEPFQVADEEVDVERPLMGFVKNDRVVLVEKRVALGLRQEDAVGHQLDVGGGARGVGEADLVAHVATQGAAELLRHPGGDRAGGDPPGLRVADHPRHSAAEVQANLGNLRRLAGAGLAGDDHDLVLLNGSGDFLALQQHRQMFAELDLGNGRPPPLALRDRSAQLVGQAGELAVEGLAPLLQVANRAQAAAQAVLVGQHRFGDFHFELGKVAHADRSPLRQRWSVDNREKEKPFSLTHALSRPEGESPGFAAGVGRAVCCRSGTG